MIARAAYLKYRYAFSYAQFTSLLAASYLIFFWAVGFVGLISSLTSEITSILMWRVGLFFFYYFTIIVTINFTTTNKNILQKSFDTIYK